MKKLSEYYKEYNQHLHFPSYFEDRWKVFLSKVYIDNIRLSIDDIFSFCQDNKYTIYKYKYNTNEQGQEHGIDMYPSICYSNKKKVLLEFSLFFYKKEPEPDVSVNVYSSDPIVLKQLALFFMEKKYRAKKDDTKISFLTLNGKYELIQVTLDPVKIDFDYYYENLEHGIIKNHLSKKQSGLLFFTGPPGTGKTFYIKYLTSVVDKEFIFLPSHMTSSLSDPSFLSFALSNFRNKILVIEDAEKTLGTIGDNRSDSVSSLLNLTDGFLGDALNLQVIATQNNTENTDPALLRSGRLLFRQVFSKLSAIKAIQLADKLNKDIIIKDEISLSDIFNTKNQGDKVVNLEPIGF